MIKKELPYIVLKKNEIRDVINKSFKGIINDWNSPFTKVEINSDEFIVDIKDIKVTPLLKAKASRGFVVHLIDRVTKDLIKYIDNKMKSKELLKAGGNGNV